jgi:hypothetical protein
MPDCHRDERIEHALDDLHEEQAAARNREERGEEDVVQRGDRPRAAERPLPPFVAVEEVPEGPRVLDDAQRPLPVVVLVREEERLVGPEPPEETRGECEERDPGPPRDPPDQTRSAISRVQRIDR